MIKLSIKERREQFLFFVALFVFTVGLLSFGMFYSGNSGHEISKEELEVKINENEVFENMVKETMPIVDTTFRQITRYNPNVQAVFLKNDIQLSLGSIKAAFDRKASDSRYKIFVQTAQLYDRLFYDRQEQNRNITDIELYKKQLEDCITNRHQLQQTIYSR